MAATLVQYRPTAAGPVGAETPWTGPVPETENARLDQVGPFRQDNPAASQANTLQTFGAVDAVAPTGFPAGRAGTIVGIVARSNADLTAGIATFRPALDGVVAGGATTEFAALSDLVQTQVGTFATPVAFTAGQLLGVMLSTNAGYLPVTADMSSYLLVKWAA